MNKRMFFLLSAAVACNGFAAKDPVKDNPLKAIPESKGTATYQLSPNGGNNNPFSGIVNAFIKAKSVCKDGEKKLVDASITLGKEVKGHILNITSAALKSMSDEDRNFALKIISDLHAIAVDFNKVIVLWSEQGRSQLEKDLLLQEFYQRSMNAVGIYGLLLLKTCAEEHPELNEEIEKLTEKALTSGKNILLSEIIDALAKAQKMGN